MAGLPSKGKSVLMQWAPSDACSQEEKTHLSKASLQLSGKHARCICMVAMMLCHLLPSTPLNLLRHGWCTEQRACTVKPCKLDHMPEGLTYNAAHAVQAAALRTAADKSCLQDAQSPNTSDFETELAAYVVALELDEQASWQAEELLAGHDFSSARAALVPSIPGKHTGALTEVLITMTLAGL